MASTVADVMVATLKASGAGRVYGIPSDSLNGFTDALRAAFDQTGQPWSTSAPPGTNSPCRPS
jgi:hypothetical protein